MAVIQLNPRTPGQRFMQLADFSGLTAKPPEKRLLAPLKHSGGRNNRGRMTSRHRGGGHKRRLRLIDFKRNHDGVPAVVAALEYDPNRSANIALLHYADGEKRYILAPEGLKVGDKVESGPQADIKPGNALRAKEHPARHDGARDRAEARRGRADWSRGAGTADAADGQGRQDSRCSSCLRASSGWCRRIAARRSARSAISTMKIFRSARPAAAVIWASVRMCAGWR